MLTAQKHPGATGMQRKVMGILTVRAVQGPTLLRRGKRERVVEISPFHAKCGARGFMGNRW